MGYVRMRLDEFDGKIADYETPPDFDLGEVQRQIEAAMQDPSYNSDDRTLQLHEDDAYIGGSTRALIAVKNSSTFDGVATFWETTYAVKDFAYEFTHADWQEAEVEGAPRTLEEAWVSSEWHEAFKEYCVRTHQGENIEFIDQVQANYEPNPTWEWADYLVATYVSDSAAEQVNLEGATVGAMLARMTTPPPSTSGGWQRAQPNPRLSPPPADLFEAAVREIWEQMLIGSYQTFSLAQGQRDEQKNFLGGHRG